MPQHIPHSLLAWHAFSARHIPCPHSSCSRWFKTPTGLKHHQSSFYSYSFGNGGSNYTGTTPGCVCNASGNPIDPALPPPPVSQKQPDDWAPYSSSLQFKAAEFIFKDVELSAGNINKLCQFWGESSLDHGGKPPFVDHKDLHNMINATLLGNVSWESFKLKYSGECPSGQVTPWMTQTYKFWFHNSHSVVENMFSNPDFDGEIDYVPYRDFLEEGETHRYENFMSGDWAWNQADEITTDKVTHGATFVPIILGSDKTTVSIATSQNNYWLVYLSIGNIHNNVRRAHHKAVVLFGFLAIPKAMSRMLESLKLGMSTPVVVQCPDRHFCRVIFRIGPYITDYPEQVLVSSIVQNWCGRCITFPNNPNGGGAPHMSMLTKALVEELLLGTLWDKWGVDGNIAPFTDDFPMPTSLVKGTFKDHLVEWVGKYLEQEYRKAGAKDYLADIDHQIAVAPSFPGLSRFPYGYGFLQWTGDDSKALMKVYLSAIEGHIPDDVVQTFRAFFEFCYTIQKDVITETLEELRDALEHFHHHHEIFHDMGIRVEGFSLPRQHSLIHYEALIHMFGSLNGLCTSITKSKHIAAVKKPWQQLSKHHALGQILLETDIGKHDGDEPEDGNLNIEEQAEDGDTEVVNEQPGLAHSDTVLALAIELGLPTLSNLIGRFLLDQLKPTNPTAQACHLTAFTGHIKISHSATATFVAPSDPSGIRRMQQEQICATPSWHHGPARYNHVFVSSDDSCEGMLSMEITCVFFFLISDRPDDLTGMWMVAPSCNDDGSQHLAVIHVDSIVHTFHNSLDLYRKFYVNHFADHHAFELAS
ncbi:hypothetical protein BDN67DRAFT_992022 [Paxillus ammoniavirescens]|nr:hypothetical protein BDN67DRAFT_992022 [Paxillus ammoniavirescens]